MRMVPCRDVKMVRVAKVRRQIKRVECITICKIRPVYVVAIILIVFASTVEQTSERSNVLISSVLESQGFYTVTIQVDR